MSAAWEPIVAALRDELEEYGGLLRLFDQQQEKIFARDAEGVTEIVDAITAQSALASDRRTTRERAVAAAARALGRPANSSLRQLLDAFPDDVRPLLEALIDEVNNLLHRSRRRLQQNQLLLGRLVEVHREVLPGARPGAFTKTYSPRGQLGVSASGVGPTFQATG